MCTDYLGRWQDIQIFIGNLCKIEDFLGKIGGNEEFSLTNGMDKFINRFVSVECPLGDKTIGM